MVSFEIIDDALWFLHAAGRSVADARIITGARWLVTASQDSEEVISAADSHLEAWRGAAELAAELVDW